MFRPTVKDRATPILPVPWLRPVTQHSSHPHRKYDSTNLPTRLGVLRGMETLPLTVGVSTTDSGPGSRRSYSSRWEGWVSDPVTRFVPVDKFGDFILPTNKGTIFDHVGLDERQVKQKD